MRHKTRNGFWCVLLLSVGLGRAPAARAAELPDLNEYGGGEAGLVVIVDPASTKKAVDLAWQGCYLLALLHDDPAKASAHNQALAEAGVYPAAQAHRWWITDRLPFRANSVNVVILREGLGERLLAEAERVIAPGHGLVLVERDGTWQERRKPRPQGMATWHGFARDGGNSFFSPDTELNLVDSVQFFGGGNRLRRMHPYAIDERVIVQSAGKIEGRDAFTGLLRWQNEARGISSNIGFLTDEHFCWMEGSRGGTARLRRVNRLSGAEAEPIDVGRFIDFRGQDHDSMTRYYRVVSDGRTIYATGGHRELAAYDAATGGQLWKTEFESFVECVAVDGGLLVAQLSSTNDSPRETAFNWNSNVAEAVVGIDAKTGKELWRNAEAKGRPSHNLAIDGEKVVACSFLFNPRGRLGASKEDAAWFLPRQYLHVIERGTGKTRFFRTDFDMLTVSNSIQVAALWPSRVGVLKDSDLTLFDAKDGTLLQQYRGPGYKLSYPAVSPKHFWTGNAAVPLSDPTVIHMAGHDIAHPGYNHRNAPANGMLYSPTDLHTVNSGKVLGSAMALIRRTEQDYQKLDSKDERRLLKRGNANWSVPDSGHWPTLRGNFERSGWLSGPAPVPVKLLWEQRPASRVKDEASKLLRGGWDVHGLRPGPVGHPVADDKRVLVAQPTEHRLICYDRATGQEQWSRRFGGRIHAAPTLAGEVGYLACDDGTVAAVNLQDGSVVWEFFGAPGADLIMDHDQVASLYPASSAAPLLHEGSLYVSAGRHTNLEMGIVVWRLNPATGKPQGHVVLDEAWVGPHPRAPQKPSTNGGTIGQEHRPRTTVADVMQVRDGKPVMVDTVIDRATMSATRHEFGTTHQYIEPARAGIGGGALWTRPRDQYEPYRLAGVSVQASNPFTAPGMILNRDLGAFAMTSGDLQITFLELGFDNIKDVKLIKERARPLPTTKMEVSRAMSARGDLIYLASRHHDGKLHLLVINRNEPGRAVADIAVEQHGREEEIIPDGIAITNDRVYLVTTGGRVLAFGPKG